MKMAEDHLPIVLMSYLLALANLRAMALPALNKCVPIRRGVIPLSLSLRATMARRMCLCMSLSVTWAWPRRSQKD